MRVWRFLKRGYWPVTETPEDVLAYFAFTQLTVYPDVRICIDSQQAFQEALETNWSFEKFWKYFCDIYPERVEHFLSLREEETPASEFYKIEQEYYKYFYKDEFSQLPEDEVQKVEAEFRAMTLDSFQDVLEGEALRLKCDVSEVRPLCHVLPLASDGDEQSKLADLSDALFLKIVNRLDTLDIFRVTLVCKSWKNVIYNNPRSLRRAEHAKTTHLITFTDWMETEKRQSWLSFERKYVQFSLGLVDWCCRVSEHLETLILPRSISFSNLQTLLQSCPNLKNLQFGCGSDYGYSNDEVSFSLEVQPPDLEFYCSYLYNPICLSRFDMGILLSCESLCYFGGTLWVPQISGLDTWSRMQRAFQNLVALDLAQYNVHALDVLANTDALRLKYLRLGYRDYSNLAFMAASEEARAEELLNRIVGRLKTLEMFIALHMPGIGNNTIKLLTQMKLNLKLAAFAEYSTYDDDYEEDDWEPNVLDEFRKMLRASDPELDLSQFCFVVKSTSVPSKLKELDLGFTFLAVQDWYNIAWYDVALNDLRVKRRLGIDF